MIQGRLRDKVAVITGSSRGIGEAIALAYAREGARVAITYHRGEDRARRLAEKILHSEAAVLLYPVDVSRRETVQALFAQVHQHWGSLDILVNNAGFLQQKPFREITDEDWDYTLAVNLKSVFICTQEAVPFFERQRSGCVVNLSSVGGQMGGPKAPHYAAAKAGVLCFTKSCARLLAPLGVRVNAISPGFIRTDMYEDILSRSSEEEIRSGILLDRVGEPEEVAAAAVYLASEEARYITGQVLNVNGGSFLGA